MDKYEQLWAFVNAQTDDLSITCELLLNLRKMDHCLSEELLGGLEREIDSQLRNYQTYFRIVQRTEMREQKWFELESLDDE